MNEGLWAEFNAERVYFYTVNVGYRSPRYYDLSECLKEEAFMSLLSVKNPKQLTPTNLIKWSE